jgi:hypothetical protein
MERITSKNLESLVGHLNKYTGNPTEAYTMTESGKLGWGSNHFTANVGAYLISGASGGWALHQMGNDKGGERDVLSSGHVPARELHNLIHAYLRGLEVMGGKRGGE